MPSKAVAKSAPSPPHDLSGRSDRRHVAVALALALVAVTYGVNLIRAAQLRMDTRPPFWVVLATPPALSHFIYRDVPNYESPAALPERFYGLVGNLPDRLEDLPATWDAFHIDAAMAALAAAPPPNTGSLLPGLPNEDKGLIAFEELAFAVFGLRIEGVLYLYFLLLFLSCAAAIWLMWGRPRELFLIAVVLVAMCLIQPAVVFDGQLGGLLAPRCIPLLGLVATVHCILFVLRPSRIGLLSTVPQLALLVFLVFLRVTALWELGAVVVLCLLGTVIRGWPLLTSTNRAAALPALLPAAALILSVGGYRGLQTYRQVTLSSTVDNPGHMFWPELLTGLAFDPVFSSQLGLRIDEGSEVVATKEFLDSRGRGSEWQTIWPDGGTLNEVTYEAALKELLASICARQPLECLKDELFFKPRSILENAGWLYGLSSSPPDLDIDYTVAAELGRTTDRLHGNLLADAAWAPWALLLIAPWVFLLARDEQDGRRLSVPLAAVGIVTAASAVPSVIGYPTPYTFMDAGAMLGASGYFLAVLSAAAILRRIPGDHLLRWWPVVPAFIAVALGVVWARPVLGEDYTRALTTLQNVLVPGEQALYSAAPVTGNIPALEHVASASADGLPHFEHAAGGLWMLSIDRDQRLESWFDSHYAAVSNDWFGGQLHLKHYLPRPTAAAEAALAGSFRVHEQFGPLTLERVALGPLRPGQPLSVEQLWVTRQGPTSDLVLSLQLFDRITGRRVTQEDLPLAPVGGTSRWLPDYAYYTYMALPVPPGLSSGVFDLTATVYDHAVQPVGAQQQLAELSTIAGWRRAAVQADSAAGWSLESVATTSVDTGQLLVQLVARSTTGQLPDNTWFVHLLDASGALLAQDDHEPRCIASLEEPGGRCTETFILSARPQGANLEIGAYDRAAERVPLYLAGGSQTDKLLIPLAAS